MNKKMVAVLVSAMMTMGLLTGCKSSDSQSGDAEVYDWDLTVCRARLP